MTIRVRSLVLAALLSASASALAGGVPGEAKRFERTFSFQGGKEMKVGIRHEDVEIESVRIRHWPDEDDFRKGERDLNDSHTMVVEFTYTNRDERHDYKCRYTVTVPGTDGTTWAENDRTATLDKGKVGDTNKMMVKMKTHRYKKAKSFKVVFDVWEK